MSGQVAQRGFIRKWLALSLTVFAALFGGAARLEAEVPLAEAIDQMARSGRWFPVVKEDDSHTWYSDPYSIVKISDSVYQINIARFDAGMRYDPPDVMNNTSVYTAEINCREMKFRPIGWRYNGQFRKNKILINSFIKYDSSKIIYFISAQVCGINVSGHDVILIANVNVGAGFWSENNKFYSNELNGNIRYIRNPVSNENTYIYCKERIGIIKGSTEFQSEAVVGSPLGALYDWVCRGLHPDTQQVVLSFEAPPIKSSTAPAVAIEPPALGSDASASKGDAANEGVSSGMSDAKRKCASLGFIKGTPKFGQCVLKLTQ